MQSSIADNKDVKNIRHMSNTAPYPDSNLEDDSGLLRDNTIKNRVKQALSTNNHDSNGIRQMANSEQGSPSDWVEILFYDSLFIGFLFLRTNWTITFLSLSDRQMKVKSAAPGSPIKGMTRRAKQSSTNSLAPDNDHSTASEREKRSQHVKNTKPSRDSSSSRLKLDQRARSDTRINQNNMQRAMQKSYQQG